MKKDVIFFAGVAILFFAVLTYIYLNKKQGKIAIIKYNGKVVKILPLSKNGIYKVRGFISEMLLKVSNGTIQVVKSGCPRKVCMKKGKLYICGDTIVCVPNKVVISVQGEEEGLDSVIK